MAYDWTAPNPTRNTGFRLEPKSHPEHAHPSQAEHVHPPHPEHGVPPNRKEPGINRDRGGAPQGDRPPYPMESTRENAAPPDRLPLKGQSDGAASEKLGETETATDEDVRQAVDFTPTMRPPERPDELDEMLALQLDAKNKAFDLELPEDERQAWYDMLPGIARDIDRLKDEWTSR